MLEDLQQQLERALKLQQENQVDAAISLFKQILTDNPDQPDALHGLGLAYAQRREYPQALHYLKQAVKIAPHIAPFHNNLGNAYKAQGKLDEAMQHYREALRLKTPYPEAHNNLCTLLYKLGRYAEATEHFQKSIRMDPFAVDTHYNLANCYIKLDRFLDAAAHFQEVLKLRPNHLGAQHNLGITYCMLKQFEHAKPLLAQVIIHEPLNIDALFHLGIIYSALAEPVPAKQMYERVLALNPQHAESHHNLATLYLHLEQPELALKHYQQALQLQPENKTAAHMIAALSGKTLAEGAPYEYTRALFDQYAYNYDKHVKEHLKYQVPYLLRSQITPFIDNAFPFQMAADLGCGTGLCAPAFADIVAKLIGVDLSPNMVELARQQGGYYKLYVMDILTFLEKYLEEFDLLIAADVFVYFGSLQEVFAACSRGLKANGLFCFSIEVLDDLANALEPQTDYQLRKTGRYANRQAYIQRIAQFNHFTVESQQTAIIRFQDGTPVNGELTLLRKKETHHA